MSNRRKARTPRLPRTDVWRRPVADVSEAVAAYAAARDGLLFLSMSGKATEGALQQQQEAVKAAEAKVDEGTEAITFTALDRQAWEEFQGEHPDPDSDGFVSALAFACQGDLGWTEDEWREEVAELAPGDLLDLRQTLTFLHTRAWNAGIPKG